jgi:hypothetical protein
MRYGTSEQPDVQCMIHSRSCELSSDGSRNCQARVNIGEEARGVALNVANREAVASVESIWAHHTGGEWPSSTADADSLSVGLKRIKGHGVGEGNARRAVHAPLCLVNVRGRLCWRLVLALEPSEDDVPANGVGRGDEAVVEHTTSPGKATGEGPVGADNLLRPSCHSVGRGEDVFGALPLAPTLVWPVDLVPVDLEVWDLAPVNTGPIDLVVVKVLPVDSTPVEGAPGAMSVTTEATPAAKAAGSKRRSCHDIGGHDSRRREDDRWLHDYCVLVGTGGNVSTKRG